ncbi:LCP family protein, partial [Candidatus Peregrinibacteria bacterium]|nr:LCP family protein [Candidatus Peregrinibacteria bacterium]
MNNFTSRKIRNAPDRPPLDEKTKQNLLTACGILLVVLFAVWGGQQIMRAVSGSRLLSFISDLFGKELQTDDRGRTNILLLGVGGEGHSGKDLTDTIIIASVDVEQKKVAMFSIPRDLYVDTKNGGTRVNRLYEMGKNKWGSALGLEFATETLQEKIGIPLHYRFKLDFEAFKKIVDAMGGIDVFVEETIDDPAYPDELFGYEPFYIEKGMRHLDGDMALKYVRSRHSSSDFSRSERQQQTLLALKKKAADKNFLSRKRLLKELYETLQEHIETNLSLGEMLRFAKFASEWNGASAATATLSDEWSLRGGFLYP